MKKIFITIFLFILLSTNYIYAATTWSSQNISNTINNNTSIKNEYTKYENKYGNTLKTIYFYYVDSNIWAFSEANAISFINNKIPANYEKLGSINDAISTGTYGKKTGLLVQAYKFNLKSNSGIFQQNGKYIYKANRPICYS